MNATFIEFEELLQKKFLLFQDLLTIFRDERLSILNADVSSLLVYTRDKQTVLDNIGGIRRAIIDVACESGIIEVSMDQDYNLSRIVAAVPDEYKMTFFNLRTAINDLKKKIAVMAMENRRFIEEGMRTIEDLIRIITRNCSREEWYNRENYLKPVTYTRKNMYLGEV